MIRQLVVRRRRLFGPGPVPSNRVRGPAALSSCLVLHPAHNHTPPPPPWTPWTRRTNDKLGTSTILILFIILWQASLPTTTTPTTRHEFVSSIGMDEKNRGLTTHQRNPPRPVHYQGPTTGPSGNPCHNSCHRT